MNYLDKVNKKILDYFYILSSEIPEWLIEYINTKELLQQQYISVTCGTLYTDLFETEDFYSSLDHSIAVALIIWNFTKDKKQTLSGLFHDIATPVFKHSIDFLNGDYMNQESTEDLTTSIISNSKEIMELLNRDGIKVSEVDDYHVYPIADNDTPYLSSDRLEYSLSNGYIMYKLIDLDMVKNIYNDISVQHDENGNIELGFNTKKWAREFVKLTSKLSIIYREERTVYSMQFLADIVKCLNNDGLIKREDLYHMKESDIIDIIKNSKYSDIYSTWCKAKKIKTSDVEPKGVYYVNHGSKVRYINPLVKGERIKDICKIANRYIDNNLNWKIANYMYLDNISFE